jgi:hypothetical protein
MSPYWPVEDPMKAVKNWLRVQETIIQTRAGRCLKPGVVLDAEPVYIDAPDFDSEPESEPEVEDFYNE